MATQGGIVLTGRWRASDAVALDDAEAEAEVGEGESDTNLDPGSGGGDAIERNMQSLMAVYLPRLNAKKNLREGRWTVANTDPRYICWDREDGLPSQGRGFGCRWNLVEGQSIACRS